MTRNAEILKVAKTLSATPLATVDDIKKVMNVTLDPAIALTATVITNQDGFNFLDKLKDGNNNYILQPNPIEPTQKMLFGKPVVVMSNAHLPTETNKAPVIIGDLKEAVKLFDRGVFSVDSNSFSDTAWKTDSTELRGIDRFDVQKADDKAAVFGQITIS